MKIRKVLLLILPIFILAVIFIAAKAQAYDDGKRRVLLPFAPNTPSASIESPAPAGYLNTTDPEFLELQERLQAFIEQSPYDIAVAVTDIQTGEIIHVKGDQKRLAGCTINFFVLLSVVKDLEAGLYPVEEVDWLILETIRGSNATTSRTLLIKTGGGDIRKGIQKVDALLGKLGMKQGPTPALFDHPPAYWWEALSPVFVQNSLTALQVNKALAMLYRGEILSPEWREYFLDKLTKVKPGLNYLIPAGTNRAEATTAHKNGFFWDVTGWVDNDIGIVMFERNGEQYAYVISLYMQKIPQKYEQIWDGQKISRMIWEYFDKKYE